jgi:Predicted membrane protein (DUF2142)
MRSRSSSLENREVGQTLHALGRTSWTPAELGRTLAACAERPLAVVLSLQLVLSVALVLVMAMRSPGNVHPDERLHFEAARYFHEHWLPPAVGAPGTTSAYGGYGMSYLNEGDIVYWALGKAAVVGEALGLGTGLSMRTLQVLLYAGLVTWMRFRARRFTPALCFLLLTPQVWYVFSYINGDALPFALLTVLLVELASPDSRVRRFLNDTQMRPTAGVFVAGALLGLLALSKRNYLVSFVFVGWAILWLKNEVQSWRRIALLASIAAVVALPWITYHAWVNDWETGKRVAAYSELHATPDLKPSAQADPDSWPYRALRTKGASLWKVIVTLPWMEVSFRSFCGLYGWLNIAADPWVYRVFGALYIALLASLVIPSLRGTSPGAQPLLVGVLICATLVVAQSAYWSWVFDFQPQGRYLFPILPMLFFYWWQCESPSLRVPALAVAMLLGTLGLFSFATVALPGLV